MQEQDRERQQSDQEAPSSRPRDDRWKPAKHTFPPSVEISDPREWGLVGARITWERVLQSRHGFGDDVLKELGITKRDLVKYRKEIVTVLRQIVAELDADQHTNRRAAVALLGELAGEEALPDLEAVLRSPFERTATRGWAALTIGRLASKKAGRILRGYLDDPAPTVRRRVVEGLELSGSRSVVPELVRLARKDPDDKLATLALRAVRTLEQRHNLKPAEIAERKWKLEKEESASLDRRR